MVEGTTNVFVALDGIVAGALVLDDPDPAGDAAGDPRLRRTGFTRIVMVTGDHGSVAEIVGSAIGVDAVLAERTPSEKVETVRAERAETDAVDGHGRRRDQRRARPRRGGCRGRDGGARGDRVAPRRPTW